MTLHPDLRALQYRIQVQATSLKLACCLLLLMLSGCHYYEEYGVLKSIADIQDEKAELLKAYRLCLSK